MVVISLKEEPNNNSPERTFDVRDSDVCPLFEKQMKVDYLYTVLLLM